MISHVKTCMAAAALATTVMADQAPIAGYAPGSDVEQHSLIDLDVDELLAHLKDGDFAAALSVYANGGNSGARADIQVAAWPVATVNNEYIKGQGAIVTQGSNVVGYVKSWSEPVITVTYTSKADYPCKAGGVDEPVTSGCFNTSENITIVQPGGTPITISAASDNIASVTNKYRTVKGFSTAAEDKMDGQRFYQEFKSYYTSGSYGDDLVTLALEEPLPDALFYGKPADMRKEVAKKGAVYMNIWMYVIREMEDAINDCKAGCINCNDDPVHAWDEAVAFYVGSLGADGAAGSGGNLLYKLANKRCANYGTCSEDGSTATVNTDILAEFNKGKVMLEEGKCTDTISIKNRIVEIMSVPLVQGALRYARIVANSNALQAGSASAKAVAEGYIFAKSILPRVAVCSPDDAAIIEQEQVTLEVGDAMKGGFEAVKDAFERNYECMGMTCKDVGGLLDATGAYYGDFSPCQDVSNSTVEADTKLPDYIVAIIVVTCLVAAVALAALVLVFRQKRHFQSKYEKLSIKAEDSGEEHLSVSA